MGGKPVLTDVNSGRFNGAHSPKLFVELYAPRVGRSAVYIFDLHTLLVSRAYISCKQPEALRGALRASGGWWNDSKMC